MSCTMIEKLLPLFVEGDLSERDAGEVRSHLSSCGHCLRVEEEFRASQQRLHNFDAPDFGTEFYAQIRGAVLAEITARPLSRPSFLQTLRTLFMWRPAAAFSLALLVLFGALSFGLYRSLVNRDVPLPAIEKSMGGFSPDKIMEAAAPDIKDESIRSGSVSQPAAPTTARNNMRQKSVFSGQRNVRPEGFNPRSIDAEGSTTAKKTTPQTDAVKEKAAPAQAVARMDIQTSDPNIRIIWLGRNTGK